MPGYREDPRYLRAQRHEQDWADAFHRDGVVVLRGAASTALCDRVVEATRPHLAEGGSDRRTNAWWALDPVRELALLPTVVDAVAFLYGRTPIPFQTLNFRRGTEQAPHRDEVHFDSLPAGFMCGAWVALEDVGADQGPVSYWPGSQDRPEDASEEVPFTCAAGDVLIWSASVVHGGRPITAPGSTRWSQVTHYFFDSCIWYTPLHSDVAAGRLQLRHPLVDIGTRRRVPPKLRGEPARFVHGAGRRSRLLAPDEPGPSVLERVAGWRHRLVPTASARTRAAVARVRHRPPQG